MTRLKPFAIWTGVALFFALTFSGCFLSNIQAWAEPGTAIMDPALLGTWERKSCGDSDDSKAKSCAITLTAMEDAEYAPGKRDKGYHIAFRVNNVPASTYNGFLFEAGGERFLQTAVDTPADFDPAFSVHTIPVIVVWRVRMTEGKLSLEPIKLSWAADLATSGKLPTHTMMDEHSPLLNVSPKEARAFLAEHAKDPQAFEDAMLWTKGAAPAVAAAPAPQQEKRPAKKK